MDITDGAFDGALVRLRSEGDPSLDASHASRRESARGSVPFACVGCEKAGGDEQAADKIDGDDKDGGGDWDGDSVGAVNGIRNSRLIQSIAAAPAYATKSMSTRTAVRT